MFFLVLFFCAVDCQAQTASATPRLETLDEYWRRVQTDGAISTMKDDILALRRDVEAQKIAIETLQKPSPTPHNDAVSTFRKQGVTRNATEGTVNAIEDDIYGLHLDLEADRTIIEKLQSEVKALQAEIDTLKSKSVKPSGG
jgi:hypothetical protein